MPYHLVKSGSGFKVKSESGTLLSKKALSRTKAEKQKIAVDIALKRSDMKK